MRRPSSGSRPDSSVLVYRVITLDLAHWRKGSRQNQPGPTPSDELAALMGKAGQQSDAAIGRTRRRLSIP